MSDPHYDKVSLLLPMSGANDGTSFPDYSPVVKTVSVFGNTKTVTAQSKFYGSSGYFDGSEDYLSVGNSAAPMLPATDDFTIDGWIRPDEINATLQRTIYGQKSPADNAGRLNFAVDSTENGGKLLLFIGAGVSLVLRSGTAMPATAWTHVEASRASNIFRLWINGTLEAESSAFSQAIEQVEGLVGAYASGGAQFKGYMQDFRITSGVARHSGNFTPPDRLVGAINGTVTDDAGNPAVRKIFAVPRLAPVRIAATDSAADGTYSLTVPATPHTVVALDDDAGTNYNALVLDRVIPT